MAATSAAKNRDDLSQQYVRECFSYNPLNGTLTWKKRPRSHFISEGVYKCVNSRMKGRKVATLHKYDTGNEYYQVFIDGNLYKAHRVVWLYAKGAFPQNHIDHINGNGLDNRLRNLRDVTQHENNKNIRMSKANKSGVVGVSWSKTNNKWRARINSGTKYEHLGYFSDIDTAKEAFRMAKERYGYHMNHGASNARA